MSEKVGLDLGSLKALGNQPLANVDQDSACRLFVQKKVTGLASDKPGLLRPKGFRGPNAVYPRPAESAWVQRDQVYFLQKRSKVLIHIHEKVPNVFGATQKPNQMIKKKTRK